MTAGKLPDDTAHSAAMPEHDDVLSTAEGTTSSQNQGFSEDNLSMRTTVTDEPFVSKDTSGINADAHDTSPSDTLEAETNATVNDTATNKLPEDSAFDISSLAFDASALTKETTSPLSNDGNQHQKNGDDAALSEEKESEKEDAISTTTASCVASDSLDEEDDEDEEEVEEEEEEKEKDSMSLRDHLRELRKRLFLALLWVFLGFLPCYAFGTKIFLFLKQPLINALPVGSDIIFTGVADGFFTELKISFLAGLFLTSPMVFYQIWSFIAPGLYKEEKIFILPVAVFSSLFFIGGAAFCYYVTFPFAFKFFLSYNSEHMKAMLSATEYLGFSLQLLFAFGVVFELPVFTFFLSRIGIVTATLMRKFRRYAALVIVIIAAILTPPDVISQMMMAFPLFILYEISILIAAFFGKKPPVLEDGIAKTEESA